MANRKNRKQNSPKNSSTPSPPTTIQKQKPNPNSNKKTKIININHNYNVSARKPRMATKGMQTPLFGVNHDKVTKSIQTDKNVSYHWAEFSSGVQEFCKLVDKLLSRSKLVDEDKETISKIRITVGLANYLNREQFDKALRDTTSLEFITWSLYLNHSEIQVSPQIYDRLPKFDLTMSFKNKFFPKQNDVEDKVLGYSCIFF